jgi:hypothetical protein
VLSDIRKFLTLPEGGTPRLPVVTGFLASLLYAAICTILALRQAFHAPYVLADDVRQHVFWMFRFNDPSLFPHDLIADYFQSLAPLGYRSMYEMLSAIGLNPLLASKLIPAVLGMVAVGYCYGLAMQVLRAPGAAFLACVLFAQSLWMNTDLCSGTPRSFLYPLALAFLYYAVRRSRIGVLVTIVLQALFFPPIVFISIGVLILGLLHWSKWRFHFSKDRSDYILCAIALFAGLLAMVPYIISSSKFAPTVSVEAARKMVEFSPSGRIAFFDANLWNYWIKGNAGLHFPSRPTYLWFTFLLPVLFLFPARFALTKSIAAGVRPLPQLALASLGMFFAAHVLLFRLYLPDRYTQHTLRIILSVAGGIVIMVLVDALLRLAENGALQKRRAQTACALALALALAATTVCYPFFLHQFPNAGYVTGEYPDLYRFFSSQPKTSLIASLSDEANNLPTYCNRSILIGSECAVPFHPAYYEFIQRRGFELMAAQYSDSLPLVQKFIRDNNVDFLLVERDAFSPHYVSGNHLVKQFVKIRDGISNRLQKGCIPVLTKLDKRCTVFKNAKFIVFDARAILSEPEAKQTARLSLP